MRLLYAGADTAARMSNGMTALHQASQAGNVGIVKALLKFGAEVAAVAKDGRTPRDLTKSKGVLRLLDLVPQGEMPQVDQIPTTNENSKDLMPI